MKAMSSRLIRLVSMLLLAVCTGLPVAAFSEPAAKLAFIDGEIAAHPGLTGTLVLDTGSDALQARAWLADHAEQSIEVQYFIWSTDNIGILAAEALLRAAERGVRVRVIVDDLLIDAPDKSLLALAKHPNIDIRIYNPKHSVGTPLHKRALNVVTDFRGVNQRMHDKTFMVDGKAAITGGRNMATEYFDYNHEYNFRDRDVLLLGAAVMPMRASFERFWNNPLSVPVEKLYDGIGLMQKNVSVNDKEIQKIYRDLHAYADSPENYAPEVRSTIAAAPASFPRIASRIAWGPVQFISDRPGKNDRVISLGGGGATSAALAELVSEARRSIVIQSPYLVFSKQAMTLFAQARKRGVRIRINTNSMASTDNIQAFSGYRNQRKKLLKMGLEIYEYKPNPEVQKKLMTPVVQAGGKAPIFSLHAKTMVVDSGTVYIGTYNLDPRSQNLNTEVGVILRNEAVARAVEQAVETDMAPGNSWNAATDNPDRKSSLVKRSRVRLWQQTPIKPLL
jgi:putative cardiolipin synthase